MYRSKRPQTPEIQLSFSKQNKAMNLEESRLNIQILRVESTEKLRIIGQVWSLQQNQLCQFFTNYQPFPHNDFSTQQLLKANDLKLIKNDGKIYFGQISRKRKEGKGIYIHKEGRLYQGSFSANQKTGEGVQIYSNGNLYIGQYLNNKKHGHGRFFWFNLSNNKQANSKQSIEYYEGDWWGGLPDGQGVHQRINGDLYTGTFKNGLKHGHGDQYFGNGDYYKGEYINGLPQGFGEYKWQDGSAYKGDFKQGLRNGYGVWTIKDQYQCYKGHYQNDKKSGYGVYQWENGWMYKGNFHNDFRQDYGELYDGSEIVYRGYWDQGEQVESEKKINNNWDTTQTPFKRNITQRYSQSNTSRKLSRNSRTIENSGNKKTKSTMKANPQQIGLPSQTYQTYRNQFDIKKRPQSFSNLKNPRPQQHGFINRKIITDKNIKSVTTSTVGSTIARPIMRSSYNNNLYLPYNGKYNQHNR